jgi:enoyl-CoA hydratase/carnithine racemase
MGHILHQANAFPACGARFDLLQISNPGKRNAMDVAMWKELRALLEALQALAPDQAPRAVVLHGDPAGQAFVSGGDITEFGEFRFQAEALREFHEGVVAPALHALLNCDIPLIALIDGPCVGGGLEIAACCDIRLCSEPSVFGVPIAKLGFPMAPLELQVVAQVVPGWVLREMLLEARMWRAPRAEHHGLVHASVPAAQLGDTLGQRLRHMASLSPLSARLNKQALRQISAGGPSPEQLARAYDYAPSREHREGIAAFVEKRAPSF